MWLVCLPKQLAFAGTNLRRLCLQKTKHDYEEFLGDVIDFRPVFQGTLHAYLAGNQASCSMMFNGYQNATGSIPVENKKRLKRDL